MIKHRGNIVKEAIEKSGYKKIRLCNEMKISRPTLDRYLDDENLELDFIIKVSRIINYDFSNEIPEIKEMADDSIEELDEKLLKDVNNIFELKKLVIHYKNKYFDTLEKYTNILEKKTPSRVGV